MFKVLEYISKKYQHGTAKLYTALVKKDFGKLEGYISPFIQITNPEYIFIGKNVYIRPYTWIYAVTSDRFNPKAYSPHLEFCDGVNIGRFCHITCSNRIVFGDNVFITENVFVSDTTHGYENISEPVINQKVFPLGEVIIGSGSWIGDGAKIFGNVIIGKHCVIGANTVIANHSVPDFCVVAGTPARIIKRYDFGQNKWVKLEEQLAYTGRKNE